MQHTERISKPKRGKGIAQVNYLLTKYKLEITNCLCSTHKLRRYESRIVEVKSKRGGIIAYECTSRSSNIKTLNWCVFYLFQRLINLSWFDNGIYFEEPKLVNAKSFETNRPKPIGSQVQCWRGWGECSHAIIPFPLKSTIPLPLQTTPCENYSCGWRWA